MRTSSSFASRLAASRLAASRPAALLGLLALLLGGLLPTAAPAQTVQAGLAFDTATDEIIFLIQSTGDLSGQNLSGAILTLCVPDAAGLSLDPPTGAFGVQLDRTAADGGNTYYVYATVPLGPLALTGLTGGADAKIELFRVPVGAGFDPTTSITLMPSGPPPPVTNGEFFFETIPSGGGVPAERQNNANPYFQETTNLPVELTSFTATRDGADVVLSWATASETSNAGFFVEQQAAAAEAKESEPAVWVQLGYVEGAGTTTEPRSYRYRATGLDPGAHRFRLKQIDFDGAFTYSAEVEVTVEMAERYVLEGAYPNPFNPEARFRFAVRESVPVRVGLYDALGREVRVLYAGTPAGSQMQEVRIDGRALTSGTYFVRLLGEGINAVKQITLLK